MSLYPSLEDMQVHKVIVAQENAAASAYAPSAPSGHGGYPQLSAGSSNQANAAAALYPGLSDFMGLELTQDVIALNMPEYMQSSQAVSVTQAESCFDSIISFFRTIDRLNRIDKNWLIEIGMICFFFFRM